MSVLMRTLFERLRERREFRTVPDTLQTLDCRILKCTKEGKARNSFKCNSGRKLSLMWISFTSESYGLIKLRIQLLNQSHNFLMLFVIKFLLTILLPSFRKMGSMKAPWRFSEFSPSRSVLLWVSKLAQKRVLVSGSHLQCPTLGALSPRDEMTIKTKICIVPEQGSMVVKDPVRFLPPV